MRVDTTELIEKSSIHKFVINSGDDYKYSINGRSGIFKKSLGKTVKMQSDEVGDTNEIDRYLLKNGVKKRELIEVREKEFNPSYELKKSESLIKFLKHKNVSEWEIVIKEYKNLRYILRNRNRVKRFFSHDSILLRIKDNNFDGFIEVGEGNTKGERFNIAGLKTRLNEILMCNRNAKTEEFQSEVPVILGPGDGGIIFHEILGHSLEADYIFNGSSPFSAEDIGRKIASENLTLTTFNNRDDFFKDSPYDDEAEKPTSKYLVKKGVIKSIISDSYYGSLLGLKCRGFSRQEDFSSVPLPRMFSIYVSPGKFSPEDLISSVKFGVYAKEFGEGKVLFNQNIFYFNINSAYTIRDGKITEPLGRVIVKGDIDRTLNSVEMIASDFQFDRGISYCLKNGQFLNVRIGQPTVKIGSLMITRG